MPSRFAHTPLDHERWIATNVTGSITSSPAQRLRAARCTLAPTRAPALIIDEESGQRRLKHRISNTLRGHGGDANTKVRYVSLAQLNLYEPTDVNALHLLVQQNNAGFVVIDALADVMPRGDENSTKDVQPTFCGPARNCRRYTSSHCFDTSRKQVGKL